MAKTTAPNALTASANADRPVLGTVEVGEEKFNIIRKPSTLMLAELARTGSGDPESIGVLADFFETTLGKDDYPRFRRAVFAAEDADDLLPTLVGEVMEQAFGRPTK